MSWYDSTDFGELLGFDRECARRLVRKMPSSEVPIELQTALHRDSARASRWQPNDVTDIDQLAMTVPYCDVVMADNAMADAVRKAHLDERYNTTILSSLDELRAAL